MTAHWLEIPLPLIHVDERYPDREHRQIYEHLKYALSRPSSFPLPAIDVSLVEAKLVVTRGHKYLRIATELSQPWIRAIFQSKSSDSKVVLDQLPPGIRITPRQVLEHEVSMKVVRGFHVYFFERSLSAEAQQRFLIEIADFFEKLDTPFIDRSEKRLLGWAFPFEGRCAEFEALIPGDSSWCSEYLKASQSFSRNVERIISFQGATFPESR